MKNVKVEYNPYSMKTTILINGQNIKNSKHCDSHLKYYLNTDMPLPLQSWIDPVGHEEWMGLLAALCQMGDYELDIHFYGRELDYIDLKNALNAQNTETSRYMKRKAKLSYTDDGTYIIPDWQMRKNIDEVVKVMLTPNFAELIKLSDSNALKEKYNKLKEIYNEINDKEFRIVFTGTYSSGKSSTINALIGKNLLPTASGTCTAKPCKIIHEKSDDSYAKVTYIAKGKKQTYKCISDTEVQTKIKEAGDAVEALEVHTDLSTLYPKYIYGDFNIVIIDTPGTDSASGNEVAAALADGSKSAARPHIEITKEVLTSQDKEIVILVADDKFEDENIVELLDLIEDSMDEDEGAFNDRFLFVMNMCDDITYSNEEECLTESVKKFVSNIRRNPNSPKPRNIINPRVFPITSGSALAVKSGFTSQPDKSLKKTLAWGLYKIYASFCNEVYGSNPENISQDINDFEEADIDYCLEQHSAISTHEKMQFAEQLKEEIPVEQRILIHSGVPALETAIKGYISHYAYPIKVKELLKSFEDILSEINTLNNAKLEALEVAKKNYIDASYQKSLKLQEEEKEKRVKRIIESVDNEINIVKQKISQVKESIPEIDSIRAKFYTLRTDIAARIGGKLEVEEKEANVIISEIEKKINALVVQIQETIKSVKASKRETTKKLYKEFIEYIHKLEEAGLLKDGGFNVKDTVAYRSIVDRSKFAAPTTREEYVNNPNKEHIEFNYGVRNFFASIKRAWDTRKEKNTILKKYVDIYTYSNGIIAEMEVGVTKLVADLKKAYAEDIKDLKRNTNTRVDRVKELLEDKNSQIQGIQKKVGILAKNEELYNSNIKELREIRELLLVLANKIKQTQIS
jgi:GTPase SAR1 family protein